jgi:hypothetical protein
LVGTVEKQIIAGKPLHKGVENFDSMFIRKGRCNMRSPFSSRRGVPEVSRMFRLYYTYYSVTHYGNAIEDLQK